VPQANRASRDIIAAVRNCADPSRRRCLRHGALAALSLGVGAPLREARAQPQAATPPNAQRLVQAYMQQWNVPGMQIAFVRGRDTLYVGSFGVADRQPRQPVGPDSLFRIASDTKAFTAAAVFLLIEAGKLRLDDRVFAPGGPLAAYGNLGTQRDWLHAITVHELLTHTAGGWTNDANDPMFQRPGLDHAQLIEWTLATHRLQNAPGQKYAYSNFGYCLLGRVIEKVSGQAYGAFVQSQVIRRVPIRDMRLATNRTAPGEVRYYDQGGENPYDMPIVRMDSHGGWIATAQDQARFLAVLFAPQDRAGAAGIVSLASLRTMTTGSRANPDYGCGLALNRAGNAWHTGSLPGTTSLMVHAKSGLAWGAVLNTRAKSDDAASRLDSMMWQIAGSVPAWRAT
jgi:D-alanyl-D-alanine carboxypeptidase